MPADRPTTSGQRAIFRAPPATLSDIPWMLAVLAGATYSVVRAMGTSPTIWVDTLIENLFVDDCLQRDLCTTVGPGATIGIFHSAGYLHWRALMIWAGFGADGTYLAILLMNALGVLLVAWTARMLDGRLSAAIAAYLMAASIGVPTQLHVISDVAPLPFLGCVFVLTLFTMKSRPSFAMTAVVGMAGAVIANVYATGLLCGVSAVWIAFTLPSNKWKHALVAAASFALTTFSFAPAGWATDVRILFSKHVGNGQAAIAHNLFDIPVVLLAIAAMGGWIAAAIVRPSIRRRLDVPAAIYVPITAAMIVGSIKGTLDPQDKYLAHALGAVAVGAAVTSVSLLRDLWEFVSAKLFPGPSASPFEVGVQAAPYVAAGLIALGGVGGRQVGYPEFTFHELALTEKALGGQRGWSWSRASRNLKTLDDSVRQAALGWATGWPDAGKDDDLERSYLVKLPVDQVPNPLPSNMVAVETNPGDSSVLAFACSWIDWRNFTSCVHDVGNAKETCTQTGLPGTRDIRALFSGRVPGMPEANAMNPPPQIMDLHFPLHPRPECPDTWVYMPRILGVCQGSVASVDGSNSAVESDGQWVRLKRDPITGDAPKELVIEWKMGGADSYVQYRGYPPFFLEGDSKTVGLLASILDRQEKSFRAPKAR